MFKATQAIITVAFLFGASAMSNAATIHVPGDYDTIQEAINAANDNDTIVVHPGTYPEGPLDLRGKSLELVGDAGPEVTKILMDTGSVSSVITITGEQPSVSITGFTITGGTGENGLGGGITVDSPTNVLVQNCWITGNYADDKGGGIYASADSQMTIEGLPVHREHLGHHWRRCASRMRRARQDFTLRISRELRRTRRWWFADRYRIRDGEVVESLRGQLRVFRKRCCRLRCRHGGNASYDDGVRLLRCDQLHLQRKRGTNQSCSSNHDIDGIRPCCGTELDPFKQRRFADDPGTQYESRRNSHPPSSTHAS